MTTVLVSGASGIVGYGILKSLRQGDENLTLVGMTIYDDSVAPGFCDILKIPPSTKDPLYIPWLKNVIKDLHVDIMIPGIELDLYTWESHREELEKEGCKLVLNNSALIALCKDKWLFYKSLREKKLPCAINSSLSNDFDFLHNTFGLPFLLKPRQGFGSQGIILVDSRRIFNQHRAFIGNTLFAQEYIGTDEDEFTIAVFGDGCGSYTSNIVMRRKLSGQGYTEKATVCELPEGLHAINELCIHFSPLGPTNFQFRLHEGAVKLLEINPRISSSTSLRTAFGYNECLMAINFYLYGNLPTQPHISQGYAVRYTEDMVFL